MVSKDVKLFIEEQLNLLAKTLMPVGTIISSTADFEHFKLIVKDPKNFDNFLSKWAPADGRKVSGSKYSTSVIQTDDKVPDLRGLFLRGINDYGDFYVSPVVESHKNPEEKKAGEFQDDMFQSHEHGMQWIHVNEAAEINGQWNNIYPQLPNGYSDRKTNSSSKGASSTGGVETRPKNMTIYYYIKIN